MNNSYNKALYLSGDGGDIKLMTTKQSKETKAFENPFAYLAFINNVTSKFRYIRDKHTEEFLATVLVTSKNRETSFRKDMELWRAQLGAVKIGSIKDLSGQNRFLEYLPYPPQRMKPLVNSAKEGRANPKGIPYLYLATEKQTAIQEIRPWLGSLVSVAQFKVVRDLKVIDCSKNIHRLDGTSSDRFLIDLKNWEEGKLSNRELEEYQWSWIDRSFSEPVDPSDDKAEYVPTQILAELFRSEGYDGIIYNSLFAKGKNLVLFDIGSAEPIDCKLYKVTNLPPFEFQELFIPPILLQRQRDNANKSKIR